MSDTTGPAYVATAPSPALAAWVQCFWSVRGTSATAVPNRVLPDGCADVIVDLSAVPHAFAVGPMRTAAVVPMCGTVDLFGVRFRPGAGAASFGASLHELCDRDVPLDALWGGLAAELEERLASARPADRVRHAERVLAARVPAALDDTVGRAVALMRLARGRATVRDVAHALGVGERRLERAFARHVGYGPKMLARVVRMQHVVRIVQRGAARGWTDVAFDAGYADQAHLVREFRALAGVTPGEYARERARVGFIQYEAQGSG